MSQDEAEVIDLEWARFWKANYSDEAYEGEQ